MEDHDFVQAMFGAEGAGFREDVAGGLIGGLNFGESSVFTEDGQGFEEDGVIGTSGPVGEVLAHEIRAEEVGPVAAGSIALGNAGNIELGFLEEGAFGVEAGLQRIFMIIRDQSAEQIGSHAGVKILADLYRDF